MCGSRKFVRGGPTLTTFFFLFFFLVDEAKEDPNTTLSRPPLARHRNYIETVFRWRADDVPILNAGLVAL